MRKMVRNCSKILAGVLLTMLLVACGSKKAETTATSSTNPAVFYSHSVAISSVRFYSWGANNYGQLGNGVTTARSNPAKVQIVANGTAIVINGVSAGGTHSLAFGGVDDPVYACGNNGFGQLGNNSTTASTIPVKVRTTVKENGTVTHPSLTGITAVAAGGYHSLALDNSNGGTVWAWGNNRLGQLGLGEVTTLQRNIAVQVPSLVNANITRIAAGGGHNLALSSSGTIWSWGFNKSGQLGQGRESEHKIPTPGMVLNTDGTSNLTDVIHIAAGGSHSLFVTSDGNVWACGLNNFGQLGDGTLKKKYGVVPVLTDKVTKTPLTGAIAVAAGLDHSLAIIDDGTGLSKGTVWAWGDNTFGQLGNQKNFNTDIPVTSPVKVKKEDGTALENVAKIVAIGNHSLAVDSSGQLWAWGDNTYGQLGNGKTTNSKYAIKVKKLDLYMPEHL